MGRGWVTITLIANPLQSLSRELSRAHVQTPRCSQSGGQERRHKKQHKLGLPDRNRKNRDRQTVRSILEGIMLVVYVTE